MQIVTRLVSLGWMELMMTWPRSIPLPAYFRISHGVRSETAFASV